MLLKWVDKNIVQDKKAFYIILFALVFYLSIFAVDSFRGLAQDDPEDFSNIKIILYEKPNNFLKIIETAREQGQAKLKIIAPNYRSYD